MADPVIIVGHKNPDNDSIAAAVSLAYLKNQLEERRKKEDPKAETREYVAACLGPLPPESAWVLEQNGIEPPKLISDVLPHVGDIMKTDFPVIYDDATMVDGMKAMKAGSTGAVAVIDAYGKFEHLVTVRMIGNRMVASAIETGEALTGSVDSALYQNVNGAADKTIPVFAPETTVAEAAKTFSQTAACWSAVVNADGTIVGTLARSDTFEIPQGGDVILVDHNETKQAVDGLASANVIEIVDHHRIGDVSTAAPICFTGRPWGSTATIITTQFREQGIEIPKAIAQVLLSAILTDTVILKSPTATKVDEEQVAYLAKIADVDPTDFGKQLFRCRGGEADLSIEQFVGADSKEFEVGSTTVLIAQHETVDLDGAMEREQEARDYMKKLAGEHGYDFVLLLVTDILAEGSNFIVEGNRQVVDKVFGIDSSEVVWMPGVLSRKKQVAAPILNS